MTMSSLEGQNMSSPPANGALERQETSFRMKPDAPEWNPDVVDLPIYINKKPFERDSDSCWQRSLTVQSESSSDTIDNRPPMPCIRGVVSVVTPSSGQYTIPNIPRENNRERPAPQNRVTDLRRIFTNPWAAGRQLPPPAPVQQRNQKDEGYVPMGRYPPWFARNLLHPTIWSRQLQATGISANYGGNIFLESNQSANIPEERSTSLWLTNLPPNCTHQLLLGTIRGCGKIYAAVINPPVLTNNGFPNGAQHYTAASKLVFFDRAGLDKLMAKSQAGEFSVAGYVPRLRMNRIKSAPRPAGPQCRVLHIEGPSCIVNEHFLGDFFSGKFKYELEMVLTLGSHGQRTRQEWRFGSYRCQAESARQAINREKVRVNMNPVDQHLWSQVSVHFGVDPCAQD